MPVELILAEAAKLALQVYFLNAQAAGMTEAQADAFYKLEKAKFQANRPDALPEVPE